MPNRNPFGCRTRHDHQLRGDSTAPKDWYFPWSDIDGVAEFRFGDVGDAELFYTFFALRISVLD